MMSRILNPSIDLQKYWEIIYRATSKFIKITCAGYERMLNIKSYKIKKKKVVIVADSIEVFYPDICIIQNDITLKYSLTDDCDLLSWSWQPKGGGTYNSSDWASLLFRGLRCNEIKTI